MSGLRNWQLKALEAFVRQGGKGYVEVCTGAGKTIFAIAAYQQICSVRECNLVVLVPTKGLEDQWRAVLERLLAVTSLSEPRNKGSSVYCLTYAKASRRVEELRRLAEEPTLIVLDEMHRFGASTYLAIPVEAFAFRLGLTATVERAYEPEFIETIATVVGPLLFQYLTTDAIRDAVLVPYDTINVKAPLTALEWSAYQKISKMLGIALSEGDVESAKSLAIRRARISSRAISRVPIAVKLAIEKLPSKTLVFFEDIDAAERCFDLLGARGVDVVRYDSSLSDASRRAALLDFTFGIASVIVSCRALDEGFDVPSAEHAIIAAATRSPRQRIQRIGRVLRSHASKSKATVSSIYATEVERAMLESVDSGSVWRTTVLNG